MGKNSNYFPAMDETLYYYYCCCCCFVVLCVVFLLCEGNCSLFKLLPILPTCRGNFAGEPSDA